MLCCVCLLESSEMLDLFDANGKCLEIADIIEKHFWFMTHPSDSLTSQICFKCWNKIVDFNTFYENVERRHKSFYNTINDKEEMENVKREKDDQCKNSFEEIDKCLEWDEKITESIEKNPLENLNKGSEIEYSNTSNEYQPSENSLSSDEISKKIKEEKKVKRNVKRKRSSKSAKNTDAHEKRNTLHRLDHKLTEQLVKKHIPMLCDLCVFLGNTFSDIVGHFKDHHTKVQPYIMCCNRKFTRSYCIDQHAVIHENPDSFRCNECNRSFTTTYGLKTHNLNYHDPEEKRIHACDFCPRRFGRRQLLEVHRQTHIPKEEWNITCPKCTTRTVKFVSQYLLNIHNSMFHKREANICHVCAKEIKDKRAFEKHVRAHFEDSGPRVKCKYPNCGRWLKDDDNLKSHMQLHNLSGNTYKCSECNKECPNRRALTNHRRYAHSNSTFRCEECDKTFKKAISLKEHMTKHTGETLYNCPFCSRTFNSNANMHAHKKKQHPIEWKELRKKNIGPLPE